MQMWGPWRPDQSGPNTGFCQIADNVLPQSAGVGSNGGQKIGYGPFPGFVTTPGAGALSGAPRGSISLRLDDGTSQVYFATATTIEQLTSTYTFTSIETGRNVTASDDVIFLKFGSFLLNTDKTDGLKAYNVQTPAGNNAVSGAPTNVRYIFSCNNVVFALDCNNNNRRMQSSGIGDHTTWTTKGADGKTFEDGGALVCGVDLKNGNAVIFQETAIRVVTFGAAGTSALYSIAKAADARGSVGERSVVSFDGLVFYLATDGFYRFDLSNGNTPIGAEKVNRWFLANIDNSTLATVQGALDPLNKIVCWRFSSKANQSATTFDRMICYDWQLNEWFTLTVATTSLTRITTPGYTLDAMDSFGVLDSIVIPLDDRFWQGGVPVYGGLDGSYMFATFTGAPMAATLQSNVINGPTSGLIRSATPISDSATSTLQLGVADQLSNAITWKTASSRSRAGNVSLRGRGFNIAFQENFAAGDDWTYANGIDNVSGQQGGQM
jgi:hypothetical protein